MSAEKLNCRWHAAIRLTCYLWAIVLLAVIGHYEPDYRYLTDPGVDTCILFVGLCVGKHYRLFFPRNRKAKVN